MIRRILSWRIFWYVFLCEKGDGYFYDVWNNWLTGSQYEIFTSYGWNHGFKRRSTTFGEARQAFLAEKG